MAALEPSGRDELKTQFMTREGTYQLMTLAEYSRPNRVGYANAAVNMTAPVKVSFVNSGPGESAGTGGEKIAFNYGRELYVYPYRGVRKAADLSKPIDKRVYKGTCPTCHDFGPPGCLRSEHGDVVPLLVGFSGGQIQLIDPQRKELSKLYNEERLIDKSRVSCLKWVPGRGDTFLVSHASGQLYTYQAELECSHLAPQYQLQKQGESHTVYTCKSKATKNPIFRCSIGDGSLNEFAFSPCGLYIATVSQDGVLRIFHYETMDLVGHARSYFGGLLCVCWSPDGKYVVAGGEDDLVTVYSFHEKRVVVRGQGHRSWVSVVSFDVYNLAYGDVPDGLDFSGSDDEGVPNAPVINSPSTTHRPLNDSATLHTHAGGIVTRHNRPARHAVTEVNIPDSGGYASDTSSCLSNSNVGNTSNHVTGSTSNTSNHIAGSASNHVAGSTSGSTTSNHIDGVAENHISSPGQESSTSHNDSGKAEPASARLSSSASSPNSSITCYRFGSVGQDTLICLWDLTEDILKLSTARHRARTAEGASSAPLPKNAKDTGHMSHSNSVTSKDSGLAVDTSSSNHSSGASTSSTEKNSSSTNSLSHKLASLNFGGARESQHKRAFSLPGRSDKGKDIGAKARELNKMNTYTLDLVDKRVDGLGSTSCPRLHDTPILEPLVVKKIAHERLTSLVFREECIVTACQDGYVCTWARPGRVSANVTSHCSGSPTPLNQVV